MEALDKRAALAAIRTALAALGKTADITAETRVLKDLDLDSVGILDFVMTLETQLDIVIPMDRIAGIETVGDLALLLAEQTAPVRP